jgi:hypothetical protein
MSSQIALHRRYFYNTSFGTVIKDGFLNMLFSMLDYSLNFEFTRTTNLLLIQLIYSTNNNLVNNATDNIYIMLYKK